MKINTFSQNKLSFGIRKPFNDELKIDTLRKTPYPYISDNRVHDLLFEKIMSAKGTQSIKFFFNNIKSGHVSKELKEALKESKDNLKRIFWDTCDRFFDVQLTKPGDNSRDDERHIPDDDELKAIFPKERTSRIDSMEYTKKFIDYYCSCYIEAKQKGEYPSRIQVTNSFLGKYSNETMLAMDTVMLYITSINKIKNHLKESIGKTVEEFRQYIMNECNGKIYTICKNKELFSYAVDKLKELKRKMAEIEIAQSPQETRQIATGKIERDPYEEVTLNNQRNEDGNSDRFKPQNVEDLGLLLDNFVDSQVLEENGMFSDSLQPKRVDDQELLVDLLYPQNSDVLELFPNSFVDSQVLEEHEMFSDRFPQQSFKDLGLSGDKFVDSQVLEEHGKFSDRFNLPNLEDFEFGLNSSQLPDTNSFANDDKLNLSRFHEFYDEAYSDKRRKM